MKKHLADRVNPYIGTLSHLLTSTVPAVLLPHGVARSYPLTSRCEDFFSNTKIDGFPVGGVTVTPGLVGEFQPETDHSQADSRCYYSRFELEPGGISVETTVTHHAYAYRISGAGQIRLFCEDGTFMAENDCVYVCRTTPGHVTEYIVIHFGGQARVLRMGDVTCVLKVNEKTELRGAVSYISFEKAREILRLETEGRTFDALLEAAADCWDDYLARAAVEGNEAKQTVFYTALYRAFQRMTDYSEHGEYLGYDGQVHQGGFFYNNDGLWDTFRCMHPLQLLLDKKRQEDILASYILMYQQSGRMPSFPRLGGDAPVMLGFHAAALFADSMAKGLQADYETAYEGIRNNALHETMLPWRCGHPPTTLDNCYYEKGFFPALDIGETEYEPLVHTFERRQAIAVTLEHAYDDWCAAQLAKALGREADYRLFSERAQNYKNLYNPTIGYMSAKNANGQWIRGFDPKWGGGQGGRDYTAENNALIYTWSVMHDVEGLAALMGGPEAAAAKLDALFQEGYAPHNKYAFLHQFPDATGLLGQFSMGNEPAFHIPYLYDYLGCPWKAQRRLRDCMDIWFTDSPYGICGDEDGGAMSSWFVFSALGFYPVCPGKPEYALGTPLFDRALITVGNGAVFEIEAKGAGDGLRYIQSAYLNGCKLEKPFLHHQDLINGGRLRLEMGRRPMR